MSPGGKERQMVNGLTYKDLQIQLLYYSHYKNYFNASHGLSNVWHLLQFDDD